MSHDPSAERALHTGAFHLGLWLPPVLAGIVLRLWHLGAQIAGGDELNGVEDALRRPLGKVLTTYLPADPCLPMAGFYRFLLDCGISLTETWVHVPPLAFGLAALIAIPWMAARRLGRPAALVLAWLVALAPLLVFYSRIARPYMPIALLGFAATAAFEAWWRTRRPAAAAAYVGLGGLCVYFHLGSAPLIVAPFLFALGGLILERREERPGLLAVLAVGLAEVAALLAFMMPSWPSLHALIGDKHNPLEIQWGTVTGVLKLQAGTGSGLLATAFWGVALFGLACLWRRDRRLGVYSLLLVLVQIAGLIVLSPEMLVHPLVFNRYLIPVFPWILVWVAVGLTSPWPRLERRAQTILVAAGIAGLFLAGPLLRWDVRSGSFPVHNDFVAYFCPPARIAAADVPRFYREVAARPDSGPVLEFPWFTWWSYTRTFYLYQEVHRQDVIVGLSRPFPGARRLRFRNMVFPDPEDFLASRARWVVVHTDLPAEEDRVTPHGWQMVGALKPQHRRELLRSGRGMAAWLTASWGEPDVREGGLLAWDLARVRGSISPATSPP
jgi:hypothetical protein